MRRYLKPVASELLFEVMGFMEPRNTDRSLEAGWNLDNSYVGLPEKLFERVRPDAASAPKLVVLNEPLARTLGFSPDVLRETAEIFAGSKLPPGAEPIAQAYAGHQFGYFTMLGDGRAILLGEQRTPDGNRFDIQLKGSGRTSYSRRGDGRAALGPMLREYIIGEAMHGFGIPTTRALAVAETGEPVYRQCLEKGAVLTRVASSHIRVGTFEFVAALGDRAALEQLTKYTLMRHYPDLAPTDNPALALLTGVIERQASLIAHWLRVGFVHGVMNTDNMALSGETIDYGPCAFIDLYAPHAVFSSIDVHGRYAYGNQPPIAQWNLARFAETLLPLLGGSEEESIEIASDAVQAFGDRFKFHWSRLLKTKLGLAQYEAGDDELCESFLTLLEANKADFTNSFRALLSPELPREPVFQTEEGRSWHERWRKRIGGSTEKFAEATDLLRRHNPAVIPRNHIVEAVLLAAVQSGDYEPLERFISVLRAPYESPPEDSPYLQPSPKDAAPYRTFCGT